MQVRGALETLVSALTPIGHAKGPKNEVQPALMNTDLLSRESESISLLLSLLVRVFYMDLELILYVTVDVSCNSIIIFCVGNFVVRGGFLCAILHSSNFDSPSY